MNVLLIDDQYNTRLGSDSYLVIPKLDIPEKLGLEIYKSISSYDLFIIDVNYKTEGVARSQNAGIALIKYLRLYQLRQHCILFSFLSCEQLLLQDPRNLIIFSPGITFIRLPYDFSTINFKELAINKSPVDLSFYFKAESILPDNRHFFANWWGMLQLWKIQKALDKVDGINYNGDNVSLSIVSDEMNSYQGLLARYLYLEHDQVVEQQVKRFIQTQVERYDNENSDLTKTRELLSLSTDELGSMSIKLATDHLGWEGIFSQVRINSSKMREELRKKAPRILYVDDQANEGWADVFRRIIYGGLNESFFVIQPEKKDSIEDVSNMILEQVRSSNPDMIILDLRLKGEYGIISETSELSGITVLTKIKEAGVNCPILVATASNKSGPTKKTLSLGASAVWVKEGLDERRMLEESIENYFRILQYIYALCLSPEYKFLKDFKERLKKVRLNTQPYWWETADWFLGSAIDKPVPIAKSEIIQILDSACTLLEDYFTLLMESQSIALRNSIPSLVVITLSGILESIHNSLQINPNYMLGARMQAQLGIYNRKWSKSLIDLRNKAVHSQNLSFMELKTFTENLFIYLNDYKDTFVKTEKT
jgi:CheY-like chemotaxis protein